MNFSLPCPSQESRRMDTALINRATARGTAVISSSVSSGSEPHCTTNQLAAFRDKEGKSLASSALILEGDSGRGKRICR